jgi:RNA polymerase sigma factor (sigma-70 family)
MALNEPNQDASRKPGIRRRWHLVSHERDAKARGKKQLLPDGPDVYFAPKNKENEKVFDNPFSAEYLRCLKNRDPEIAEHFYSYFSPKLRMKLRGRRLQESDVHDIVQETFTRALNAVDNDEIHSPMAFGGYVSRVCDFVLYDLWYKNRPRENRFYVDLDEIDIPDPTPGIESVMLRRERREQVAIILSDLRPKDRDVLRAKLFDDASPEDMCARFGASSADHLRLMLHRARKKFAEACEKRGLDFGGAKSKLL